MQPRGTIANRPTCVRVLSPRVAIFVCTRALQNIRSSTDRTEVARRTRLMRWTFASKQASDRSKSRDSRRSGGHPCKASGRVSGGNWPLACRPPTASSWIRPTSPSGERGTPLRAFQATSGHSTPPTSVISGLDRNQIKRFKSGPKRVGPENKLMRQPEDRQTRMVFCGRVTSRPGELLPAPFREAQFALM